MGRLCGSESNVLLKEGLHTLGYNALGEVCSPAFRPMPLRIRLQAIRIKSVAPQGAAESVRRCPCEANEVSKALFMGFSWSGRSDIAPPWFMAPERESLNALCFSGTFVTYLLTALPASLTFQFDPATLKTSPPLGSPARSMAHRQPLEPGRAAMWKVSPHPHSAARPPCPSDQDG